MLRTLTPPLMFRKFFWGTFHFAYVVSAFPRSCVPVSANLGGTLTISLQIEVLSKKNR